MNNFNTQHFDQSITFGLQCAPRAIKRMSRNCAALALLMCSFITTHSQCSDQEILDSILVKAQATSLYTYSIDWQKLKEKVYQASLEQTGEFELKPALSTMLNEMRDHHGAVRDASSKEIIASFSDHENKRYKDERTFPLEEWKIVNDVNSKFEFELLPGSIGYLKIVGIGPMADIEKEAKQIRQAIESLSSKKVNKWIIDLRYNGGGNIHPMLEGLAPLLGDGKMGSIIDARSVELSTLENKNGNFNYYGVEAITLPKTLQLKSEQHFAVLTSRWTSSSGELVATAFKGAPRTKFFGEATGGYTTNNNFETICNKVILTISTGIFCDRTGKSYPENIPVDEEIPFMITNDHTADRCIQAACRWLKK